MDSAIALTDAAATAALGARLAQALDSGDIVLIDGELGTGKTTLVRAVVAGLGGDVQAVASPTFTLLNIYPARIAIYHVDAWRLSGVGELRGLGFSELAEGGIGIVEWAERIAAAFDPPTCWRVQLSHSGDGGRRAMVIPPLNSAGLPRPW